MRRFTVCAVAVVAACADPNPGVRPSFDSVFPAIEGDQMTISSPALTDLSGDGVSDIVFGTGVERVRLQGGRYVISTEPDTSGYVVAVSGATNEILWKVGNPRDAFTTPRFIELNGDRVQDVVMGGREGSFSAFSGVDGALLWRVPPSSVAKTSFPYNFFRPGLIRDVNRDGIADMVVVYGGDDTRLPKDPRQPSYVAVVSGTDGKLLAVRRSPDGNEMYSSVVVYERPDGTEWVVFGTGGETHGGGAYRAPVASLLDGTFGARAEPLIAPGPAKGVIAPATLVELTGDREFDIVINTFDGRLIAVNGATGKGLWERRDDAEESYHSAAVLRIAPDGKLGLFLSRGMGAFPRYVGSRHRLLDAATGSVLYDYRDTFYPGGAPLAVDLTGDGIDEPVFFSQRFPSAEGGRIHILDVTSRKLIAHDVPTTFATTPVIADPRNTGHLELIGLSWRQQSKLGPPDWRDLRWQLLRLNLNAKTPTSISWGAYMGTVTDGQFRPRR